MTKSWAKPVPLGVGAVRSWSAGDRDKESMILCSCSRALAPEPRKGAQSESGEEWGGRRSGAHGGNIIASPQRHLTRT